jgi:acyl-CoA dehydrogenase
VTAANWFDQEPALKRILQRQLGPTFAKAEPRLQRMGERAASEVAAWSELADRHSPRLIVRNRDGARVDDIEYHPAYRWMQDVAYGGGIVAASYDPELAPERGKRPKALTFGLGYVFGQAEAGLYCPVCMTDGAARLVQKFGTEEHKARFIPRLASRDLSRLYTGAMFLTEKAGGTDVGLTETVAKGSGPVAKLYGEKWFCSNVDADVIMILARPEGAGAGTRGLGLYLLPKTLEDGRRNAFRIERLKDKLGVRSMPTGEVLLDGAEAYLLGGPGQGFLQMTEMLNTSRLYNAVASVGAMRRAVVEAMAWAESRVVFGKKLVTQPLMTEVLMDLAAEERGALHWVFRAVELMDRADAGEATPRELQTLRLLTPLSKYYTAKRSVWAASEAIEALGGNGYIEDWPTARLLRDAQVLPVWEGATNVLVLDAFRAIRKDSAHEGYFAELEGLMADAPSDLRMALGQQLEVLHDGLGALGQDAQGEHALRDWTDRASVVWEVGLLSSAKNGAGATGDLRAARRLLDRNVRGTLLRKDRASPEELRQVAFT